MTVDLELNVMDQVRFNIWHHYLRTPWGMVMLLGSACLVAAYLVAVLFGWHSGLVPPHKDYYFLVIPLALLGIPAIAAAQHISTRRANPSVFRLQYKFDKGHVEVKGETFSGTDDWRTYAEVVETRWISISTSPIDRPGSYRKGH